MHYQSTAAYACCWLRGTSTRAIHIGVHEANKVGHLVLCCVALYCILILVRVFSSAALTTTCTAEAYKVLQWCIMPSSHVRGNAPAPSLPTYTSRGASGCPPLIRIRMSASLYLGLNTSVSTPRCHTSMDFVRQSLRLSSSCNEENRQGHSAHEFQAGHARGEVL